MKAKILTVMFLVLVSVLSFASENYAGQAQASAGVIVIIPPRPNENKNLAQKEMQKEETTRQNKETAYAQNNQEEQQD